jgi:two-component sensor histidine kinase
MANSYEDDMTIIMVKSLFEERESEVNFEILPSLSAIEDFLTAFDDEADIDFVSKVDISLALNELLLNAFEHGTIGITYDQKQKLLDNDTFDEYISKKEREIVSFNKKIKISIIKYKIANGENLMRVIVEDTGDGFDVSFIIKEVNFANNIRWHGRGIKLTQTLVDAIFYNNIGNKAEIFKIFKGE